MPMKPERKPKMSPMKIDHDAIKNLATLLNETDLTEIEIAEGDKRIRVTRTITVQAFTSSSSSPQIAAPANMAAAPVAALSPENHPGAVKSPMVGTVYLQSEPSAPKFITKGQTVQPGDTLLIIEAMKVMNPIKAEKGGTVLEILIDDSQPVEFGQPLVIIA
jgi:acetyl-CoA carboxylase biotin carboxyl carrier protein